MLLPRNPALIHRREVVVEHIHHLGRDRYMPSLRAWCGTAYGDAFEIVSAVSVWFESQADADSFAAVWCVKPTLSSAERATPARSDLPDHVVSMLDRLKAAGPQMPVLPKPGRKRRSGFLATAGRASDARL